MTGTGGGKSLLVVRCQHQSQCVILPVHVEVQVPRPYSSSDGGIICGYDAEALFSEFKMLVKHVKCRHSIYHKITAVSAVYCADNVVVVAGIANVIDEKSSWGCRLQQKYRIIIDPAYCGCRIAAQYGLSYVPLA